MEIINKILKTLVYLSNTYCIIGYAFMSIYLGSISDFDLYLFIVLGEIIVALGYIYLTCLFYKNIKLNKKNDFKIIVISIITTIIETSILIFSYRNYINVISLVIYFLWYCLPKALMLISVKFNELYMNKLKS
ncbi:MAG: hypothetical protein ACRDDE_08120 [Paraclostridium sp.]|uniref:hypothetical protein n=1 Tax=Paraclostridium sp. TaxID=2023273 RepID=UPI003EE6D7DF